MDRVKWSPIDFGWGQRVNQRIFYLQNYDLREIRPNIWLLRKRIKEGEETKYLVKFLQYIPEDNISLAKMLLKDYLNPVHDKEFNTEISYE
jgi:hypothetical protein